MIAGGAPAKSWAGESNNFGESVRYIARTGALREGQEPALAAWSANVSSIEGGWERADNRTKGEKAKEARERGLSIAELRALERPAAILAALTTHEVAFSLADAQSAVMERVNDKAQHQSTLDAILAGAAPLRHKTTGEDRFTTPTVLQAHADLNEALHGLAGARIGAVADAVQAGLTEDQKRAFRYATGAGGKLRTITGVPGAGKTRLINAVAEAYRAEGYTVRAVSVANSAVEVLRSETDVFARSVAAELWQWSQDRDRLGPRDLLIIDEASTLGTAWARDLLAEARSRGAVVVLLGDYRQFQAVAYGNALGAAQAIEPGVDMQTTMRQKTE